MAWADTKKRRNVEWAKTKRLERILRALDAYSKGGKRWQTAFKLDPAQFSRAQGKQTGQPIIRVGFDATAEAAIENLFRATAARAALRALPYLSLSNKDTITLHKWTDGVALAPIRWGAGYAKVLPDRQLAAAVDGEVWKNLREDAVIGRDAFDAVARLFSRAAEHNEPTTLLLIASAFGKKAPALPEKWQGEGRLALQILVREAIAGLLRQLIAAKLPNTLYAELAAFAYGPAEPLPPAVAAALGNEPRQWRARAAAPSHALSTWGPLLANLDEEVLEKAYDDRLRDEIVGAALTALLGRDATTEIGNAALWQGSDAGNAAALPAFGVLEKLNPEAHQKISAEIKEGAGRFKGKHRRQLGAEHLTRLALLHHIDEWLGEFRKENSAILEVSTEEPARLAEESARGGLYAFALDEAAQTQTVSGEAHDVFQTGHLFADLKGFTALTAKLKETEVRQFLRQNFYEPLLKIAKDYFKGGVDMADRGGVRLNNLMGDAISLCGDPADLLRFAERATKLVHEGITEVLAKRSDNSIELDCGFFVSYGPAPVDLKLRDDIFGNVYVALAEKINESARGVARDGGVYAALERFAQKQPGRAWAFNIHVGPSIAGGLPDALLDGWPTEPDEADVLAKAVGGSIPFEGATAMYNVGIGLSPETAVKIVADHAPAVTFWQGKTAELALSLGDKFLLVEPKQTFLLFRFDGHERLLRRCGKVVMKGFKQPPTVWEWVGPWQPVFDKLAAFVKSKGKKIAGAEALQRAS